MRPAPYPTERLERAPYGDNSESGSIVDLLYTVTLILDVSKTTNVLSPNINIVSRYVLTTYFRTYLELQSNWLAVPQL